VAPLGTATKRGEGKGTADLLSLPSLKERSVVRRSDPGFSCGTLIGWSVGKLKRDLIDFRHKSEAWIEEIVHV